MPGKRLYIIVKLYKLLWPYTV